MHEEASSFERLFSWLSANYPLISAILAGTFAVLYKIHRHFSSLSRLADHVEEIQQTQKSQAETLKEQSKTLNEQAVKLAAMMESDDVDSRVKPVIDRLVTIEAYLLNRKPNERHDD